MAEKSERGSSEEFVTELLKRAEGRTVSDFEGTIAVLRTHQEGQQAIAAIEVAERKENLDRKDEKQKTFVAWAAGVVLVLLIFYYCPEANRTELIRSLVPTATALLGYGVGKAKKG